MSSRRPAVGVQVFDSCAFNRWHSRAFRSICQSGVGALLPILILLVSTVSACTGSAVDRALDQEFHDDVIGRTRSEMALVDTPDVARMRRMHTEQVKYFSAFHDLGEAGAWRTFSRAGSLIAERGAEVLEQAVRDGWPMCGDIHCVPLVMSYPSRAIPDPVLDGSLNWARCFVQRAEEGVPCIGVIATPNVASLRQYISAREQGYLDMEGSVFFLDGVATTYMQACLGWVRRADMELGGAMSFESTPEHLLRVSDRVGTRDSILWVAAPPCGNVVKVDSLLDQSPVRAERVSFPYKDLVFLRSPLLHVEVRVAGIESDPQGLARAVEALRSSTDFWLMDDWIGVSKHSGDRESVVVLALFRGTKFEVSGVAFQVAEAPNSPCKIVLGLVESE